MKDNYALVRNQLEIALELFSDVHAELVVFEAQDDGFYDAHVVNDEGEAVQTIPFKIEFLK